MRTQLSFSRNIFALFCTAFIFSGCMKDSITRTYTLLRPVYKDKNEVLASIGNGSPTELKAPGKIYALGRYLYINEINKGVHIYDNGDITRPKAVAFISIPGNIDIAVKENILYADLFTDLLAIDISDPLNTKLVKKIPNVFPERVYTNGFFGDSSKYIIDWIQKDTTVDAEGEFPWNDCRNCFMLASADMTKASGTYVPGIAGSMARFAIVNDYLYTVNSYQLGVHSLSIPADPQPLGTSSVGSNIETIYPFKDRLFIGSSNGMFIYNINDPATPARLGNFTHASSCDPVVADDNYAFVTLRSGTACMGYSNQLDILNVQNLLAPQLIKTYSFTNPHGLAKDGNVLFICDGKDGLKVFDASNVRELKEIHHFRGIDAYDVIAWNKRLTVVAKNGVYQFDYSNPSALRLLSKIAINR